MSLLIQIVKFPFELLFLLVFTIFKGLAFFSPVLIALGTDRARYYRLCGDAIY